MSEKDRLVACVDIYQALSEDRPYKKGMDHAKCMSIMRDMASRGLIDARITEDIDKKL
jgi:HD-GYP domain-containing protein (c-di-GMP phosphodiesterase class II)